MSRAYIYIGENADEKEGDIGGKYIEYFPSDLEFEVEYALNKKGNGLKIARLDLITHSEFMITRKSINPLNGFEIEYSRIFDMDYSLNRILASPYDDIYEEQIWFFDEETESTNGLHIEYENGIFSIIPDTLSLSNGRVSIPSKKVEEIINILKQYHNMESNDDKELSLKDNNIHRFIPKLFDVIEANPKM